MEDNGVIVKKEEDSNDSEDLASFPVKEEMDLVDLRIKEERLEPFKKPLPGPNTIHQGFAGQPSLLPGDVMGDIGFDNFPLTEEKILPDDPVLSGELLGADMDKAAKLFGKFVFSRL